MWPFIAANVYARICAAISRNDTEHLSCRCAFRGILVEIYRDTHHAAGTLHPAIAQPRGVRRGRSPPPPSPSRKVGAAFRFVRNVKRSRWRDVFGMERGWHYPAVMSRGKYVFPELYSYHWWAPIEFAERTSASLNARYDPERFPPSMITSAMSLNEFRILLRNIIYDIEPIRIRRIIGRVWVYRLKIIGRCWWADMMTKLKRPEARCFKTAGRAVIRISFVLTPQKSNRLHTSRTDRLHFL